MIELVICFRCDTCAVGIESRSVPGINVIPSQGAVNIGKLPVGWSLTPDGQAHCPEHQPRLVEPVGAIPNLPPLTSIKGGRR